MALLAVMCVRAQVAAPAAASQELEQLARALRASGAAADRDALATFAERHAADALGARAALALGYHEHGRKNFAQAQRWLARAGGDSTLREYVLYWSAQTDRALGEHPSAITKLQSFRRDFPESAIREQALGALADSALATDRPSLGIEVLADVKSIEAKPDLLLLRARAHERAGLGVDAARDYALIYYSSPRRDEARPAGVRLQALRQSLAKRFPAVPIELQWSRAEAFFQSRAWREARAEFTKLLPRLNGAGHERARLRIAQCRVRQGASLSVVASLKLEDADVGAERLFVLSQFQRARRREAAMLDAIVHAAARYPKSPWTEEALFAAGNYYLVALDRLQAVQYYRRVLEQFPAGANARVAHWRIAWTAYLERRAEAAQLIEEHLRRFPRSSNTPNALYWLGRLAERAGRASDARGFYAKLSSRFPETYFALEAGKRLAALGAGPTNSVDILTLIPPTASRPKLDGAIPAAGAPYVERARALRMIAFDSSAELEFRAAHAVTGAAQLLVEAAQAAFDAGRYPVAVSAARQAYPELEARRVAEGPEAVWRLVYPLPYDELIRAATGRAGVDVHLVAGIIRQESTFQRDAVSRAGAVGLMQILPSTGRILSRRLRLRYSRARLTQPEYNLRLGTTHLADVLGRFDKLELALAAYNAGPDNAAAWQAERAWEEMAEFVESIPFTETREYVQVVIRNAEIYRRLYGKQP